MIAVFHDQQLDGRWIGEEIAGQQIDFVEKFAPDPIGDKAAWRIYQNLLGADLDRKRFDPGIQLLYVQRTREMGNAMAPEFVHEQRGGSWVEEGQRFYHCPGSSRKGLTNQGASGLMRDYFEVDHSLPRYPQ